MLIAVALVTGGVMLWVAVVRSSSAGSQDVPQKPDRPRVAASLNAVRLSSLAVSPDGEAAACLEQDGTLRIFSRYGRVRLTRKYEGARLIALSGNANRAAIAGSSRDRWWIRFVDGKGSQIWRQNLNGEVLDIALSPGGTAGFASLRGRRMYMFDLSGSPRWKRVQTPHDFASVSYSHVSDGLIVRTTAPAGFGVASLEGDMRWWKSQPNGQFHMESGEMGSLILTTAAQMSPAAAISVSLYNVAGRHLFTRRLDGFEPRAAVSADGRRVALSYRRKLEHEHRSVMERRIGLWTPEGQALWEQGGLFFNPVLAGLAGHPFGLLVAEDYNLLSSLDGDGRLAWRGPALRSDMVRVYHDENWRLAWVYYKDNGLELWQMSD